MLKALLTVIAVMFVTIQLNAAPTSFVVDDPGGKNVATFTSQATLEKIVGTTNAVTGTVTFDPSDLSKPVTAKIAVDLRSVTTGIKTRDEHMNGDQYLNTAVHPLALFEMNGKVSGTGLVPGTTTDITFAGNFTIHGVTKPITVTGKATFMKEIPEMVNYGYVGDLLAFDGSFTIKLADYNIKRPEFLFLKLSEEQLINIQFTAASGRSASSLK